MHSLLRLSALVHVRETTCHVRRVLPCIPLVVEWVELPVFALVDLGHRLVQEVLGPEVVFVARPAGHASARGERGISGTGPLGVTCPTIDICL